MLLMAGLMVAGRAAAQAPPPAAVPSPALPSNPLPQAIPLPQAVPAPPIVVPEPGPAPPANAGQVRFPFNGLSIDGGSIYPAGTFDPLWRPLAGRTITLAELYAVAQAVQDRYRADGYILTRVLVPAQRAEAGQFALRIVEGYVDRILVQGDAGPVADLVARTLEPIRGMRPVTLAVLDRHLLLAEDIPGIAVAGTLRAGDQAGASDLIVTVRRSPFDGYAAANNRGSNYTGPLGLSAGLGLNSFTRLGERLSVLAYVVPQDDEQQYYEGRATVRLGGEGLTLGARVFDGPSHPGFRLAPLDVDSDSRGFGLFLSAPVLRGRERNLDLSLHFDWTDETVDVLDTLQSRDRVRVLRLRARGDVVDDWGGSNEATLGLHKGLDFANGDQDGDPRSRPFGRDSFLKVDLDLSRQQEVAPVGTFMASGYVHVAGQYSFQPLLSSEQFRLGNATFGRGYAPSELTGDNGVGATVEARLTGTAGWRYHDRDYAIGLQFYTFYDAGLVWSEREARQALASAGGGVRAFYPDGLALEVEVAKPLTRQPLEQDGGSDPEVYFRVSTIF